MGQKKKDKKVLDNKCPSCKAPIFFNPKLGKWKCEYCDSEFTIEDMKKYTNAGKDENNNVEEDTTNYVSYKCENCGAEIVTDEQTAATFCIYCGNTAILKNKLSGKFAPNYLIPFKKNKEEAIEALKNIAKGRPFMPKDFNSEKNIEKIKGVYIPFWLFDIQVDGDINCSATKVSSWTSGDTHYTKTDNYLLYRSAIMAFDKIPADGSTRFDDNIMNSIEPFDYKDLIDYNHAYLSGFYAEKYDVVSENVEEIVKKRAIESAKDKMLADCYGYTTKLVTSQNINPSIDKITYVLLPVWMVNVKYKNKYYIFAMNGQTGEFIGDIPLDKKKVIICSILLYVGIAMFILIMSYFVYLAGR